jgi:hypothetical protein
MSEEERQIIVATRPIWLADGLSAGFAGWKNPDCCGVHSARPGFWACSWETAKEVIGRPDRRFLPTDRIWKTGNGWFGLMPSRDDYQTEADWEHAQRGEVVADT